MGEFGEVARGHYWLNLIRYLSERDMDFAFWPLNGRAYKNVRMSIENANPMGLILGRLTGHFDHIQPQWEDESFGLLNHDYVSIRRPWILQDLQALIDQRPPADMHP